MEGPGKRTYDPVPKETTGYALSEVDNRKCASILRLLLDAHTVQNLSLKGTSEVGAAAEDATTPSTWAVDAGVCTAWATTAGGGGGGGGG